VGTRRTAVTTSGPPTRWCRSRPTLTADPTNSRFAYAVWDRLELTEDLQNFRGPTLFTRTTDGGQTWERPRVIFDPGLNNQTIANQIAVVPNGRLVNVFDWIIQGQLNVGVMFSDDQGRTWTEPKLVTALGTIGITDPFDGAPVRTGDLVPDIAVDPRKGTRNIYLVWQDARFAGGLRDQIALVRSSDGGKTWTTPRRVSSNLDTQAFTASVEVNDRGHVGVTYYDFTRDSPTAQPLLTDHWLTVSTDKGAHFSTRERQTARSFDMRLAPLTGAGFFVGDYVGLDGVGRRFHPVFGVTRKHGQPGGHREHDRPAAVRCVRDHPDRCGRRGADRHGAQQQPPRLCHETVADSPRGRPASTRRAGLTLPKQASAVLTALCASRRRRHRTAVRRAGLTGAAGSSTCLEAHATFWSLNARLSGDERDWVPFLGAVVRGRISRCTTSVRSAPSSRCAWA
jgi:hypothetical protein